MQTPIVGQVSYKPQNQISIKDIKSESDDAIGKILLNTVVLVKVKKKNDFIELQDCTPNPHSIPVASIDPQLKRFFRNNVILVITNLKLVRVNSEKSKMACAIDSSTLIRPATPKEVKTGFITPAFQSIQVHFKNALTLQFHSITALPEYMLQSCEALQNREEDNVAEKDFSEEIGLAGTLNLESLLNDDTFKDVVIKTGKKSFKAHKCIISRSRYLKEKIAKAQSNGGLLEIDLSTEFDEKILQSILHYLYTQQVEKKEITWELLHAAIKLNLNTLARKCAEILKNEINEGNVLKHLRECKNAWAIYYCYQFISSHKDKEKLLSMLSREELLEYLRLIKMKETINEPTQEISLEAHLFHLFKTKEFSDITFVCSDHYKVKAHKAIVLPYLQLPKNIADTNPVDVEGAVFTMIIEYLYDRNLKFPELYQDPLFMKKLMKASEKYLPTEELHNIANDKMMNLLRQMPLISALRFCIDNEVEGVLKTAILKSITEKASREDLLDILPYIAELN